MNKQKQESNFKGDHFPKTQPKSYRPQLHHFQLYVGRLQSHIVGSDECRGKSHNNQY